MSSSYLLDSFVDSYLQTQEEKLARDRERIANPTKSRFVQIIVKRNARGKDSRIVITGESGDGKSTLMLRLSELLDAPLYVHDINRAINDAVSFTSKEYMTGIRTLPSESALDFDEPGQGWYHRQFMSEASMILSKTMIGFRYKKFKSFLTLPNIDLLDADALRLVHYLIDISEQGRAEVFRVMRQKFGGDPWFKKIIDNFRFSKPDTKLWHLYEKKKFEAQDALYEKYGKRLDELEAPHFSNQEILKLVSEGKGPEGEPVNYVRNGKLHIPSIQRIFKIGLNRGYLVKAMLEDDPDSEDKSDRIVDTSEPAADLLSKVLD